ncbi:hypothetical protein P153DRAFT_256119, partial [Dothidotthia symphoricarpi CBS 119687]
QRWPNDTIPAGVHQFWLPSLTEKTSTVFFVNAHRDSLVGALPHSMPEGSPSRYKDIAVIEFHNR